MAFEIFQKQGMPGLDPAVTIQRNGRLSLNKPALELLGDPKFVELMYDREQRLIGIRKVPKSTPHGYPLRPVGDPPSSWVLSGKSFLDYYGLNLPVARRWMAQKEGSKLVIDLKRESQRVGRGRVVSRS